MVGSKRSAPETLIVRMMLVGAGAGAGAGLGAGVGAGAGVAAGSPAGSACAWANAAHGTPASIVLHERAIARRPADALGPEDLVPDMAGAQPAALQNVMSVKLPVQPSSCGPKASLPCCSENAANRHRLSVLQTDPALPSPFPDTFASPLPDAKHAIKRPNGLATARSSRFPG